VPVYLSMRSSMTQPEVVPAYPALSSHAKETSR
jgi:hypothetical protein